MPDQRRRSKPPGHIEALATLPIFLKLGGRRAVVAGGTPPAVWKAELLAAAGAKVAVMAAGPCTEMVDLAETLHGALTLERRDWQPSDLLGAAIAVGALEIEEGERFRDAAHAAGVPVNVIDVPALCDFQFGTIIARSPLVIGISTDGAAPVFGQALRARIEALLPAEIGAWAQAAKDWRGPLQDMRLGFAARRQFWEIFADMALEGGDRTPTEADRLACMDAAAAIERTGSGRLILVGAGPGEAEMITLQAVRALQRAETILHEPGLPASVLGLGRREARRVRAEPTMATAIRVIEEALQARQTIAWAGPGDPSSCPVWQSRVVALGQAGLSFETVRGLRCGVCPRGCAFVQDATSVLVQ